MLCKRCKESDATVKSRKEPFCNNCFIKFVSLKQRKRMMTDEFYRDHFKVLYGKGLKNDGVSKIVLPFNFDSSCLTSMDVLFGLLKEQRIQHRGRVGFKVEVLTLYKDDEEKQNFENSWMKLKTFNRYDAEIWELVNYHLINVNVFFNNKEDLQHIVLHNENFDAMGVKLEIHDNKCYTMDDLLKLCPNRNTKNDFWIFIMKHLIKKFTFQQEDAEIIVWSHSMTRLADEIIGLVVKGRGAQIALSLDSETFDQDYNNKFKNLYPLKDILLKETDTYCFVTGLDNYFVKYESNDDLLITKVSTNKRNSKYSNIRLVKNMTINELARKYFDDIDNEYSNIIATVLRTGDKLKYPEVHKNEGSNSNANKKCSICFNTIHSDPSQWLHNIAVNESLPIETEEEQKLYKLWQESHVGIQIEEYLNLRDNVWEKGQHVSLCYGCIINMNGIKTKEIIWPKHDKEELQMVLDEYQLTNDEDI